MLHSQVECYHAMCECGHLGQFKREKNSTKSNKAHDYAGKMKCCSFHFTSEKLKSGSFLSMQSFKLNACILSKLYDVSQICFHGFRSSNSKAQHIHFNASTYEWVYSLHIQRQHSSFYFTTFNIIQMWLDPSYSRDMHGHCPITLLIPNRAKKIKTRSLLFLKQRSQNCIHIMRLAPVFVLYAFYTVHLKFI